MGFRTALVALGALALGSAALAADDTTAGPSGAQAFLEGVYNRQFGPGPAPRLDRPSIYDAALMRLLAEDARLNEGFVGALAADPLCQCQDTAGFHAQVKVARWKRNKALAHVQIENGRRGQELTIDLIYERGHWRIDDITPQRGPGLRKVLERSNKHIRRERGLKR